MEPGWESVVSTLRAAGCVFAEDEARLLFEAAATPAALRDMVARRVAGLPLEHIVGWVEFCGLRVAVDPGVFVPRQRTALLVRRAAAAVTSGRAASARAASGETASPTPDASAGTAAAGTVAAGTVAAGAVTAGAVTAGTITSGVVAPGSMAAADAMPGDTVAAGTAVAADTVAPGDVVAPGDAVAAADAAPALVDLACGSGAVGMAVAARVGNVSLYAVDIEPAAVRCARRNLAPMGGRVYEGDLYAPLPDELRGRVDVLVANVPYVPTEAMGLMPREARVHEPRVTLDGGRDGLDVLRRVAAAAGDWLAPGGYVLMEIGEDQADAAVGALTAAGLEAAVTNDDELHAWIVVGQRGR